MGTPSQVADQLASSSRNAGVRNLMLKFNTGEMDTQHAQASMKMFGEKVMPLLQKI